MSKIARPLRPLPSGGAGQQNVPTPGQKPSTSSMKPTASKAGTSKAAAQGKKTEFTLPAFSIAPKKPKATIDWDLVKRDMARRQAPEGEDVRSIKRLMQEIADKKIPVHEFINLVSSYTSDNGAVLRTVMTQDVDSFRKLARKVYETMTQDVSDVLVNEQLNLMRFYEERHTIYTDKMMNAINQIYEMAPKFDFDRFLKDKQEYLNMILPLPVDQHKDEEEKEMQKRQQAYHRLLWLRSEGERMAAENQRLQARLKELKQLQDKEQDMAAQMAAEAETKRQQLVQEEAQVKDHLDNLSRSVEKKFVENEALANKQFAQTMAKKTDAKGKKKGAIKKKRIKRPEWVSDVATDIEKLAAQEVIAVESEAVPPTVPTPKPRQYSPPRQRSPPQMQQYPQQQQQRQQTPQMQQQQQFQQRQPSPQNVPMQQYQQRQPSPQMQQYLPQGQPQMQAIPPRQTSPQMQAMPPRQPSPQMQAIPPRQPSPQMQAMPTRQPPSPQMQTMGQRQASHQMYQQQMQTPQARKETRIEQASTTTQVRRGRRVEGPRDSWGGFY